MNEKLIIREMFYEFEQELFDKLRDGYGLFRGREIFEKPEGNNMPMATSLRNFRALKNRVFKRLKIRRYVIR